MPPRSPEPMLRSRAGSLGWLLLGVGVSACGAPHDASPALQAAPGSCEGELGQGEAALSVVDRSLVGSPADYAADPALRDREAELRRSQRERRRAAWQIAERVLSPVRLPGSLPAAARSSLPAWQTWHAKDDLTRLFRHLYPELSAAQRASRARFSAQALDRAWRWNDGAVNELGEWSVERLAEYEAAVDEAVELHGLAGIYRVSYSSPASRHWLDSYPEVLGCRDASRGPAGEEDLEFDSSPQPPCSPSPPSPACLAAQFPRSSALVKASWRRVTPGEPLPVFDTSAEGLARRLTPDQGFAWGEPDGHADPSSEDIYTLRLPNGNAFRLVALHIMTKELDDWFWTTLWWSDSPDQDFGADRPPALPSPWDHYKLCSVVSFEERDPDPTAGFGAVHPSLARALAATHAGAGGPSWCSNPYIEEGPGNAATNCIGCHQHAGTALSSEQILSEQARFPEFGRTEQRASFPSDYVFEGNAGDNLGAMFEETEAHFE